MKSLVEFITESITVKEICDNIQSIQSTTIEEFCDNIPPIDASAIGLFLKGKGRQSALNIYFIKEHKYLHVNRYVDMHHITLSFVYDSSPMWPLVEAWDKSTKYEDLDDRMSMKELTKKFIDYLKTHHHEFS